MFQNKTFVITFVIFILSVSFISPLFPFAETTPPSVTIDNSTLIQGKNVTLTGTAKRNGLDNFDEVKLVLMDGTTEIPIDKPVNGIWTYTFPNEFPDGEYNFSLIATDLIDNTDPTTISFTITVDTTAPEVSISSSSYLNSSSTISGVVTDGATAGSQPTVKLYDSTSNLIGTTLAELKNGEWAWSFPVPDDLSDGTSYQYMIEATDSQGYTSPQVPVSFTLDNTRPKVTSILVNYADYDSSSGEKVRVESNTDLLTIDDMNHVTTASSITVIINDTTRINKDDQTISNPIVIKDSNGEPVDGNYNVSNIGVGNKDIQIVFTPVALEYSTTYNIFINPAYIDKIEGTPSLGATDAAGNPVFPLIKKFTTERDISNGNKFTEDSQLYPHGNYTDNTNSCATCHSTHIGVNDKLEQPSVDPDLEYTTSNYCMACHDGTITTVAVAPENMHQNGHFSDLTTKQNSAKDCAACHNPHLTWSEDNPNLLDNHYVVENHPSVDGVSADMFDSDKVICETCHGADTATVKNFETVEEGSPSVQNKTLHYRKLTASGVPDDYALCFRCHDGTKTDATNIKNYYTDSLSKHRIAATDGKPLNMNSSDSGHIPCSECHDTHGSSNVKILKGNNEKIGKLGHENRQIPFTATDKNLDLTSEEILTATKEREFCLKCHDGSTAIFGVTGKALTARSGHDLINDKGVACASCHGYGDTDKEKALSAAHAPK